MNRLTLPLLVLALLTGATQRDYSILIRGHRLEPAPRTVAKAESGAWIVQFDGPLTRERTKLLRERFGLRLNESIPHFAFLERLDAATLREIQKLDFFRWSGRYEPRFKIDPAIGKRRGRLLVSVTAFPGTRLDALAKRIRALGLEVVSMTNEPQHGILRLQVRVRSAKDADAIARIEDVKSIEEVGGVTLNE